MVDSNLHKKLVSRESHHIVVLEIRLMDVVYFDENYALIRTGDLRVQQPEEVVGREPQEAPPPTVRTEIESEEGIDTIPLVTCMACGEDTYDHEGTGVCSACRGVRRARRR